MKNEKKHNLEWLVLVLAVIFIGIVAWQELHGNYKFNIGKKSKRSYVELTDTNVNGIDLRIYTPHKVSYSLFVGDIDRSDSTILFATQAADVRADNGAINGSFVLKGEQLAKGGSKKGFCAIIDDNVTVGVDGSTTLFGEAIDKGGYFFRQFPLVDNGKLVENDIKGKSIRRALCDRKGKIFTVEALSEVTFHDFAQALVDFGVDNAIYLVGSTAAYGWAVDADGVRHEFGNPEASKKWKNTNYLVMRAKR